MQNEITTGIAQKLSEVFGDACEIHTGELAQGFTEPCFYIACLQSVQTERALGRYLRAHNYEVQYYPAQQAPVQELAAVAETLYDALEYIEADGAPVRGTKLRAETEGGVLRFYVSYDVFLLRTKEPAPYMEKLEQTQRTKI